METSFSGFCEAKSGKGRLHPKNLLPPQTAKVFLHNPEEKSSAAKLRMPCQLDKNKPII